QVGNQRRDAQHERDPQPARFRVIEDGLVHAAAALPAPARRPDRGESYAGGTVASMPKRCGGARRRVGCRIGMWRPRDAAFGAAGGEARHATGKRRAAWTTRLFGEKLDGGRAARHVPRSQDLRPGGATRCVGTNPTGGGACNGVILMTVLVASEWYARRVDHSDCSLQGFALPRPSMRRFFHGAADVVVSMTRRDFDVCIRLSSPRLVHPT